MNTRTIAVSLVCMCAASVCMSEEPRAGQIKDREQEEFWNTVMSGNVLNMVFEPAGVKSARKRVSARQSRPDAEEIIRTLNVMINNVEMSKESLDKDGVIQVFRDYSRIMQKQCGIRTRNHRKEDAVVCAVQPEKRSVRAARAETPETGQPEGSGRKTPITTQGLVAYGPERPSGIFAMAVKKHISQIKPMRKRVGLKADKTNIKKMINTIRKRIDASVVVDTNAIRNGIRTGRVRPTVTLKVDNMTLENALNWICRLSGLAWTIKDEAIFITTPDRLDRADENKLKIYDIRDLKNPIPDFPGPEIGFGENDTRFQEIFNFK